MAVNEYDAIITWPHCDRIVIEQQATVRIQEDTPENPTRPKPSQEWSVVYSCVLLSHPSMELKIPRTLSPCRFESDLRHQLSCKCRISIPRTAEK